MATLANPFVNGPLPLACKAGVRYRHSASAIRAAGPESRPGTGET